MTTVNTSSFTSSEFDTNSHTFVLSGSTDEEVRITSVSYVHEDGTTRFSDLDSVVSAFNASVASIPSTTYYASHSFPYSSKYDYAIVRSTYYVQLNSSGNNLDQFHVHNIKSVPETATAVYGIDPPPSSATVTFTVKYALKKYIRSTDSESGTSTVTNIVYSNGTVTFTDVIETSLEKTRTAIERTIQRTIRWRKANRIINIATSGSGTVVVRKGENSNSTVVANGSRVGIGEKLFVMLSSGSFTLQNNPNPSEYSSSTASINATQKTTAENDLQQSLTEYRANASSEEFAEIQSWVNSLSNGGTPSQPNTNTSTYHSGDYFTVYEHETVDKPIIISVVF